MKKILVSLLSLSFVVILFSCNGTKNEKSESISNAKDTVLVANQHLMMAVLYQQQAAECKALYYQAYNMAQMMLDNDLKNKSLKGKRAVVVDIDETVLDNSPFEAAMISRNAKFPEDWAKWTQLAKAKASPGSLDFLSYAASKGVEVFYVSNRSLDERDVTIANLIEEKFPMADTNHVIVKTDESSKVKRRNKIMENYRIVLLVGDNLTDFDGVFDKTSPEVRNAKTDELRKEFGKKFIMLPNAMYGDWEKAMYEYSKTSSSTDKDEIRKSILKDF